MLKKPSKSAVILFGLYLIDILFIIYTNPSRLPLLALIVPFILMFLTIFLSLVMLFKKVLKHSNLTIKAAGLAFLGTIFPVMLALFESIHQLTAKDVILSLIIMLAMAFYLLRAKFI